VVTISNANAHVTLSKLTIRNGLSGSGGGVYNVGTLTINNSTLSGNAAVGDLGQCFFPPCYGTGGGIYNIGALTINNTTLSGNSTGGRPAGFGGGIYNHFGLGPLIISNSTLSGNSAFGSGSRGGGIDNAGALRINNGTLSGNSAGSGGGIYSIPNGAALQNSIVANSPSGGNCSGTTKPFITSNGYNLSSDNTCNFHNTGDLNNTNLLLGTLGNYGGPTQTIPLLSGSPAIDAGNPSGCTDGLGHLLKTDQRGKPRHDAEDTRGCDIGAYERQND